LLSAAATANERDLDLAETAAFLRGVEDEWNDTLANDDRRRVPISDPYDGALQWGVWLASAPPDARNNARSQSTSFYIDPVDVRMSYGISVGWTDSQNRPDQELASYLQAAATGADRLRAYDDRLRAMNGAALFERAVNIAGSTRFARNDGQGRARPLKTLGDFFDLVDEVMGSFATNVERNPNSNRVTRNFQVAPGRRLELFEALETEMRRRTNRDRFDYDRSIERTLLQGDRYDAAVWRYFGTTAEQADHYRAPDVEDDRGRDRRR
jgi:hypothetical protein